MTKQPYDTEWLAKFSNTISKETIDLIAAEMKIHGAEFGQTVILAQIYSLVFALMFQQLDQPGVDPKTVHEDFAHMRLCVQGHVSEAFQGAFEEAYGTTPDYQCDIYPLPEPKNDKFSC